MVEAMAEIPYTKCKVFRVQLGYTSDGGDTKGAAQMTVE